MGYRYDEGDSRNWTTQQINALWGRLNTLQQQQSSLHAGSGITIGNDGSINVLSNMGSTIGVNLDGGGVIITTGQKRYVKIPFNCTITEWSIISREVGSITFDIWKKAGVKPTVVDTITASAKPTLASSDFAVGAPTGWNVSILAGDIIGWNVDSVATVTWAALQVTVNKT